MHSTFDDLEKAGPANETATRSRSSPMTTPLCRLSGRRGTNGREVIHIVPDSSEQVVPAPREKGKREASTRGSCSDSL